MEKNKVHLVLIAVTICLGLTVTKGQGPEVSNVQQLVWIQTEDDARTHGILVEAPPEARKRTALLHMHPRGNHGYFLQDPAADAGYTSLSLVARHNTDLVFAIWEDLSLDVAAGVQFLLSRGYSQIVLMGTSSSGPLLSFYQNLAENEDERQRVYGESPPQFPPSQGLILCNPTVGHGSTFVRRLDPSLLDEDDPSKVDPALDMYNPRNWASGNPETLEGIHYSQEFLDRYRKAQSQRMNQLIERAEKKLKDIEQGNGRFIDDDLMVINGIWAQPWYLDLSLGGTTLPMVKADPAVGANGFGERPMRNDKERNRSLAGAAIHSAKSFLSFRSIRSSHPYTGLDVSSSNGVTTYHLSKITIPMLFVIGTADVQVYLADFDENFRSVRDDVDKSAVFIKGANHGLGPTPGHRQQAIETVLDWMAQRFPN